jgi:hypothetical protein
MSTSTLDALASQNLQHKTHLHRHPKRPLKRSNWFNYCHNQVKLPHFYCFLMSKASAFDVIKKKKKTATIHFYETFRLLSTSENCINWKWSNSTANPTLDTETPTNEEISEKIPDDNIIAWKHEFSLKILKKNISVTLTTNYTTDQGGMIDWKSRDLLCNQPSLG